MKKNNKIYLSIAVIGIVTGTLFKLKGYKAIGDIVLGVSTSAWLLITIPLIYNFMTRKLKS